MWRGNCGVGLRFSRIASERVIGQYRAGREYRGAMPDLAEAPVLDLNRLPNICMDDAEPMRELAVALVDDATMQVPERMDAIQHAEVARCGRVADYVKGA
jgi:hypothetical protein